MPKTAHFSLFRAMSKWKEPFWSSQYINDYYWMTLPSVYLHSLHLCIVHLKDLSRRDRSPAVQQLQCGLRWTKADWSWALSTCSSTLIWWLWCALWEMKCLAEILRMQMVPFGAADPSLTLTHAVSVPHPTCHSNHSNPISWSPSLPFQCYMHALQCNMWWVTPTFWLPLCYHCVIKLVVSLTFN